jgi:hypothetical protein
MHAFRLGTKAPMKLKYPRFKAIAKLRFVTILCLLFLAPIALAQSDAPFPICRISSIPGGYVIVGVTTLEQCRANSDLPERENAWMIRQPRNKEVICENSPYPGDFAVTGRTRSVNCPNNANENYNNAWTIERLRQ